MSSVIAIFATVSGCERKVEETKVTLTGGNPKRGKIAIRNYGCGTCHRIPGIYGANGVVGPPLEGVGTRSFLAGMLPNTPENMMRWVRKPQDVNPRKVMPDVGVTESDARDIAAYLYTLGESTPIR